MLPTDYDLRLVQQRCLDLRAEADTYRRVQAAQQASTADLSIVVRLVRFVLVARPARQLTATQQAAA
jgi:hypothetical protein